MVAIIPVAAGTFTTSVVCQAGSHQGGGGTVGGGVNVPSASCFDTDNAWTASASASVTVSGIDASVSASAFISGAGFVLASADYNATLNLLILAQPNLQAPGYVRLNLGGFVGPFVGITVQNHVTHNDILTACPGTGVPWCIPLSGGLFDLHLSADNGPQGGFRSFSGVFGFLDHNGTPLSGVQYTLTDVTAPEPGTMSLMLTGLLAAAAAMDARRRSASRRV